MFRAIWRRLSAYFRIDSSSLPGDRNERKRLFFLWMLCALLIFVILVPLFHFFWKDRTRMRAQDECEMLADAALKRMEASENAIQRYREADSKSNAAANTLIGWAAVHGGITDDELEQICSVFGFYPDAAAVRSEKGYEELIGEFPEELFSEVLEQVRDDQWSDISETRQIGEFIYIISMPDIHIDDYVISRIRPEDLQDPAWMVSRDWDTDPSDPVSSEGDLSVSGYIFVRTSDHSVTRVQGDFGIQEGDILEELPDGSGILKIGNRNYIAGVSENSDCRAYALADASGVRSKAMIHPALPAVFFVLLFLLIILYAWFLRGDILKGRVEQSGPAGSREDMTELMIRHVRLMFMSVSACVLLLILLLCTLFIIDRSRIRENLILDNIENYFQEADSNTAIYTEYRSNLEYAVLKEIDYLTSSNPERFDSTAVGSLALGLGREIFILNRNGSVVIGTERSYDFSGLYNPESPLYKFSSVLEGRADDMEAVLNDETFGSVNCLAVRRENAQGMIFTKNIIEDPLSVNEFYSDYRVPGGLILFAVDGKSGEILSCSEKEYTGRKAESIGLTENVRADGFAGDVMVDGRRCFVQAQDRGNRLSLIATDLGYLGVMYAPLILVTFAAGMLLVILMLLSVFILQADVWENLEPAADRIDGARETADDGEEPEDAEKQAREAGKAGQPEENEENASFYREENGDLRLNRAAVGRWLHLETPFRSQSADEKFRSIVHRILFAVLIAGWLIYQNKGTKGIMGSTLAYLLQRSWLYGINIYSICYALLAGTVIYTAAIAVRRIVLLFGANFGNRGETVARLISSFIGYMSVLGAIAYGLLFLGVNTAAILTSVGIVGLAVSIGARDLVSDILSGISIVFEGEFRTGDIVEIGGFRGEVEEIGIRTTKVMSMGNVKIFRNSSVSGVINLTQRYSIAQVQIQVARSEPYAGLEALFKEKLPGIRENIPEAVMPVELCGISDMNDACVTVLFQTRCREADRVKVERAMRREFELLMEKEGILPWGRVPEN